MVRVNALRMAFLLAMVFASVWSGATVTPPKLHHSVFHWTQLSSKSGAIPSPGPSIRQTASLVFDVDKDGINDFIIATSDQGPSVVWYRRNISGWTKYVIDSAPLSTEAGGTFVDVDGDGDLDIIFGSYASTEIWWWENPYPNFDPNIPWTRRAIKNSGENIHHDQIAGDFDGDGKPELVFWNQNAKKLFLANIPKDPKNAPVWSLKEIFSWEAGQFEGLAKFDIDGDGKLDIVGGGRWFKHKEGTNYIVNIIDEAQSFSRAAVGQLIKGGWPEVVFVPGDGVGRLKWYEWTGKGWLGYDLLNRDVVHGHSLEIADFNGDGNLDIFCAEMRQWSANKDDHPGAKMWIFLGDGKGNFEKMEIASGYGNHESKAADLDGDGDVDLLIKPFAWDTPRVEVWLNNGTKGGVKKLALDKWQRHVVDSEKPWRSLFIAGADLDGDGKKDIVTGGWWYRNPGSPQGVWKRNAIGAPLNNMAAVYDFDGDGHPDVLGTEGEGSAPNSNFVWARNNGKGVFTIFHNIAKAKGDFLQGVAVARFTNLGPLEVALSWHAPGHGVQMFTVPKNSSRDMWSWRKLTSTSQDEQLSAGDIDRDGTVDLLLGTKWLCNGCPQYRRRARALDQWLGTNWLRWRPQTLSNTSGNPDRNRLADINGDGCLDAVVGFEAVSVPGKVLWYEQPCNGAKGLWKEHTIATVVGPMSLDVADMDGDGDLDVIIGEHNLKDPASAKLYVFENVDGKGNVWLSHVVSMGDEHHDGAVLVDIDGDGDLDIISIGWGHSRVLLYENKAIDRRH
jgi:hypothetical protein